MDFYEGGTQSNVSELRQGDILCPVPFAYLDLSKFYVYPPGQRKPEEYSPENIVELHKKVLDYNQSTPKEERKGFRTAAGLGVSAGIIVNQTCDLLPDNEKGLPIVVASIVPYEERIRQNIKNTIKDLRNSGKRPNLFLLPSFQEGSFSLPMSLVDIYQQVSFAPRHYNDLLKLVKLRLCESAQRAFQERLWYCLGRNAAPKELYKVIEDDIEHQSHIDSPGVPGVKQ